MRPGKCVACEVPGVELSGRVNLHGNGTRARPILGPAALGEEPKVDEVLTRRYECQRCGAVMVVGPRGLVPGYLYSAMAIGVWNTRSTRPCRRCARTRSRWAPKPSAPNQL